MKLFVDYLYTSTFPKPKSPPENDDYLNTLVSLYVFAEKIDEAGLMNAVMDVAQSWLKEFPEKAKNLNIAVLPVVYESTKPTSKLRTFITELFAFHWGRTEETRSSNNGRSDGYADYVYASAGYNGPYASVEKFTHEQIREFYPHISGDEDLFTDFWALMLRHSSITDPCKQSACYYHTGCGPDSECKKRESEKSNGYVSSDEETYLGALTPSTRRYISPYGRGRN